MLLILVNTIIAQLETKILEDSIYQEKAKEYLN